MDVHVRHAEARSRYELVLDDEVVGVADYRLVDDQAVFPHTEIRADLRGRGLGDVLVRGALDDVRTNSGRQVVARCWFVSEFIDANPDYADLRAGDGDQSAPRPTS